MQLKPLGATSLQVGPLALGTNVFGWTTNEKQSFDLLDAFVDAGLNLVDTADMYPRWATGIGGESESIIGKWIKRTKKRQHIILATKVGKDMGEGKKGLSPAYIEKAVDDSLRRLQTDYIDLYQSHEHDANTPIEVSLVAFEKLIKAGKVRFIGASNYSALELKNALSVSANLQLPRYECFQPHYNLYTRHLFEAELEQICKDNQLGVIPYFPLASGFLTGKYRSTNDLSKSVRGSSLTEFFTPTGTKTLAALDTVAQLHSTTPAAVALAWLMAKPVITAPIASATSTEQLAELISSVFLQLNKDDMLLLDSCTINE